MADQQQRRPRRGGDRRPQEEKQFDERVLSIDRVARVVKGGRRFRFRALVVIGDRKQRVGVGVAKSTDVPSAINKAVDVAKRNMITVDIYNDTIPHEAEVKHSGARILIKPAAPGTGLIAGGVVRTVLEVAGIKNIISKSLGSSNKLNVAQGTIEALKSIKPAKDWVTRQAKPTKADDAPAKKVTKKVTEPAKVEAK